VENSFLSVHAFVKNIEATVGCSARHGNVQELTHAALEKISA